MKEKKLPIIFYVVSLGFAYKDNYTICFNAKEIKNALAKYIKVGENTNNDIIIKVYRIENRHILEDFSRRKFVELYLSDVNYFSNGLKHIEEISINLNEE